MNTKMKKAALTLAAFTVAAGTVIPAQSADAAPRTFMVSGVTFLDNNKNYKHDTGDKALANKPVHLVNTAGRIVRTTKTNNRGQYYFKNLRNGTYTVRTYTEKYAGTSLVGPTKKLNTSKAARNVKIVVRNKNAGASFGFYNATAPKTSVPANPGATWTPWTQGAGSKDLNTMLKCSDHNGTNVVDANTAGWNKWARDFFNGHNCVALIYGYRRLAAVEPAVYNKLQHINTLVQQGQYIDIAQEFPGSAHYYTILPNSRWYHNNLLDLFDVGDIRKGKWSEMAIVTRINPNGSVRALFFIQ